MVERLKQILDSRFRISTQLYLAVGGAVVLTLAASLVGWFSFDRVGTAQSRVNEGSVPELAAAFGVAQYSGVLVAAAPNLTAATTPERFDEVVREIDSAYASFEEQLATLEAQEDTDQQRVARIRSDSDTLISNIKELRSETSGVFDLRTRLEGLQEELTQVRFDLDDLLAPAIDDQLFFLFTGIRSVDEPASARDDYFTESELARYRRLSELQGDVNIATELLANAFTLSDASLVEPLRERFEAARNRIERNLGTLVGTDFHTEASPTFDRLFALGVGGESVFGLFERDLRIQARQAELLASNRDLSVGLVAEVDELVMAAQASAADATDASSSAIFTGRTLLLVISAVSVVGAVLIIWLYLGRILLRRLNLLTDWMRRMAGGDIETSVEMEGRDEVADMAAALEVFRRHALEVQRLNLVEQLAGELQEKNVELESTLGELNKAQDQIVMREKLASLGELTAGVAHEIRNPLNFVNNFSEVSGELLTELQEVLEEDGVELSEEQQSYIEEITGDLTSNLERIQSHGQRANRIVENMLRMGRSSGEWQMSDINGLLDEHAKLAYHSARATDSDFQLDIKEDYAPDTGEMEVIPQDLGRVFLNMVSNACYATNERRAATPGADVVGGPYSPTIWLSTRRTDDHIEVRIKDNGTGMPAEVAEKIFNPFFTTKPTDQGTGLGLSLSSDIVRRHGGTIRVDSVEGEYTEMIIELPLERPAETTATPEEVPA
ncbi:MAG: HAMP domain-containing protein [Dehalococcoidia bacterium]|nr:HAMP domain-containing protein [Dehalococcoidia bacterium]